MENSRPKILIVDDRMENLVALEEVLEDFDVEMVRALSGNEAVARSIRNEFALILMDVQMPEMDGFEAVELIRKEKRNENTPVIFISAIYSDDYYKIKGVNAGGVDFITKPIIDDVLIGKVKIFLEIYEQKLKLQEAIKNAKELAIEAQQADRAKTEFLTNMSHEFRTPLNSILLLSKTIAENAENNMPQEQAELATDIHSAGQKLLIMVSDLLDLVEIETSKLELKLAPLDLQSFIENLEKHYKPIAVSKGLFFRVELKDDVPIYINTDSRRLHQILRNLLSNAFKFTLEGGVNLRVSCNIDKKSGAHTGDALAISVTDTGVGIAEDKLEEIFKGFYQVDGGTSRQFGGTGQGLLICRELATLLDGNIQVESVEGKGSTFTMYFSSACIQNELQPVPAVFTEDRWSADNKNGLLEQLKENGKKRHGRKLKAASICDHDNIFCGKKILLVEDDMENIRTFKKVLSKEGFEIIVGVNGRQGLEALRNNPDVDLVLMDIMMPVMDGYTAMTEIRKLDSAIREVPIIAVTGKAMEVDRQKCIKAGADEYLTKPVDLDKLFLMIENLIIRDGS